MRSEVELTGETDWENTRHVIRETVCFSCKNLLFYPSCLAFPDRIPYEIRSGRTTTRARCPATMACATTRGPTRNWRGKERMKKASHADTSGAPLEFILFGQGHPSRRQVGASVA